jgi:ribosomal-protein-alanine N-acetyltransferase
MQPPIIKTSRLTLAFPFTYEGMDVDHYVKWLNDPAVMQYSEQRHVIHTTASQYEYLGTFPYCKNNYFWEIQLNTKPIGSITAYLDIHNRIANLGIMIGERRQWGNGYASEAWSAVSEFLFESKIRKLEAGCMGSNRAMISLLEKTGFTLEATILGHFILNNQPQDKVAYGKFRQAKIITLKKAEAASNSS